ncbi:hypothetical protein KCV07_g501, partial [Aureobasidium melanogenum]
MTEDALPVVDGCVGIPSSQYASQGIQNCGGVHRPRRLCILSLELRRGGLAYERLVRIIPYGRAVCEDLEPKEIVELITRNAMKTITQIYQPYIKAYTSGDNVKKRANATVSSVAVSESSAMSQPQTGMAVQATTFTHTRRPALRWR